MDNTTRLAGWMLRRNVILNWEVENGNFHWMFVDVRHQGLNATEANELADLPPRLFTVVYSQIFDLPPGLNVSMGQDIHHIDQTTSNLQGHIPLDQIESDILERLKTERENLKKGK